MAKSKQITEVNGTKFRTLKRVNLPFLKLEIEKPYYLRFDAPMFIGKSMEDGKLPPTVAHVTNMETGEQSEILVNAVLRNLLEDHYPDNGYVGHAFEVVKHEAREGRGGIRYSKFDVSEIAAE